MSISVVIPAYNAGRTLGATLASVERQTRLPDEIVIVDDCSSDDTVALSRGFVDRLPSLQIIPLKQNAGVSHARNIGIKASGGTLIATLDADDVWHPTYLEKMERRLAASPDAGFAYAFFREIDADGRVFAQRAVHAVEGWGFYQLLNFNYVANGSNTVYRRARLDEVGGFDTEMIGGEDRLLHLLLAWRAEIANVPEHLVGYRDLPGSLSKRWREIGRCNLELPFKLRRALPTIAPAPWRWDVAQRHKNWAQLLRGKKVGSASEVMWHELVALACDPRKALAFAPRRLRTLAIEMAGKRDFGSGIPESPLLGRDFFEVDPAEPVTAPMPEEWARELRRAARFDEAHSRGRRGHAAKHATQLGMKSDAAA